MAQASRKSQPPRPRRRMGDETIVLSMHRHPYALARASFPFALVLAGLALALAIAPAREFLIARLRPLVYVLGILPLLGLLWHALE